MSEKSTGKSPRIFLSAGEHSGDLHSANLIRALKTRSPGAKFAALGGDAMEEAGASLVHNMLGQFSIMGFLDVPRILPAIKRVRTKALALVDQWKPDAAVLVDYPGFNINLAFHLKKRGIPVFYYICPQIWAWAPWRIHKIARRIDKALVVFEFEEEFFSRYGVPVEYVGHPLGDFFSGLELDKEFLRRGPLSGKRFLVTLLPGSRSKEITAGLPVKAEAAKIIAEARAEATFAVPVKTEQHAALARTIVEKAGLDAHVFVGKTHEVMSITDFALATSGTATLELAHFGVPMVVLYRTNPAGLFFKSILLTTPDIALANIVAGRRIVPEMVYWRNRSETIAAMALAIMNDPEALADARKSVRKVGERIDAPGASAAAAKSILDHLR